MVNTRNPTASHDTDREEDCKHLEKIGNGEALRVRLRDLAAALCCHVLDAVIYLPALI